MEYIYRNVSSIFFSSLSLSFFNNLLSFPFLRKGRFSPRFSEWNVNFESWKRKKCFRTIRQLLFSKSKVSFRSIIFCHLLSIFLVLDLTFSEYFSHELRKKKKKRIIWAHTYELFNIQCLFVFQYDLGCWIYKFVGKEGNWIEKYRQRWDEYFNDIQQRVISRVALYPLKYLWKLQILINPRTTWQRPRAIKN